MANIEKKAHAEWKGRLQSGAGTVAFGENEEIKSDYNFETRFGDAKGVTPEDYIAAAQAACFSMALSADLEKADVTPLNINTVANLQLDEVDGGFAITSIRLDTEVEAENIDQEKLNEVAETTRQNCPVSKALTGVGISVNATLKS